MHDFYTHQFFIPITKSILTNHPKDLFYFMAFQRYGIINQTVQLTRDGEHSYKQELNEHAAAKKVPIHLNLSRTTWSKWRREYCGGWEVCSDVFVPISFNLYDSLERELMTLPPKSRNPYMRTFVYLYFNICYHRHNFECSIERLARETETNANQTIARLNWLMERGFIERAGTFKFSGNETFSFHYFVPHQWKPTIFKEDD